MHSRTEHGSALSGGPQNTIGHKAEYAGRATPCSRVTNRPGSSRANAGHVMSAKQRSGIVRFADSAGRFAYNHPMVAIVAVAMIFVAIIMQRSVAADAAEEAFRNSPAGQAQRQREDQRIEDETSITEVARFVCTGSRLG